MARQPLGYGVEEIPVDEIDYTGGDGTRRPLRRGESGLPPTASAADDSAVRIRQNAATRTITAPMRGLPPEPMPSGVQEALAKSNRVLGGTQQARVAPRRLGGAVGALAGAIPAIDNARRVYEGSEGDIGQTARQIGFDAAPLLGAGVGGALGAAAGGVGGAPSGPGALATGIAGATALGSAGYAAGDGAVRSLDRAIGGTGVSPLEDLQQRGLAPQAPRENVLVSAADGDVPTGPGGESSMSVDPITGRDAEGNTPRFRSLGGTTVAAPATAAAPAAPAPAVTPPAVTERDIIAEAATAPAAPATPAPAAAAPTEATVARPSAPLGSSVDSRLTFTRPDGGTDTVQRTDVNGVPTFTNIPGSAAAASGSTGGSATGARPLANTISSAGVPSIAELDARDARRQATADARMAQQRMRINEGQIQSLIRSGSAADLMQARALMSENRRLGDLGAVRQGTADTFVNNERQAEIGDRALRARLGAQNSAFQQLMGLERLRMQQGQQSAADDANFAGTNREDFNTALAAQFGRQDPESGQTVVPQATQAFLSQYQPNWVQQQEADYGQQLQALRAESQTNPQARERLAAVQQAYQNFRRGVYRLNSDGSVASLRPVSEMDPTTQQRFFDAAQTVQRGQQDQSDPRTLLGGLGGAALGGLAAGARRTPAGRALNAGRAILGAAAGGLGGAVAGNALSETPNAVVSGANVLDPTMDSNVDSIQVINGDPVLRTRDGNLYNLGGFQYQGNNPGVLGRSRQQDERTSQFAPLANAYARRLLQQARNMSADDRQRAVAAIRTFPGLDPDLRTRLDSLSN